jgi:hypothetical protein
VDHVNLKRVVLAVDVVLRGSVHVELDQLELGTCHCCGAVDDDFNGGTKVLELDFLFGNVEGWLLCHDTDGSICHVG